MKSLKNYIKEANRLNDVRQYGFDYGFTWMDTLDIEDMVNCIAWSIYGFVNVCKTFGNNIQQKALESCFDKLSKLNGFNKNADCKKSILEECMSITEDYTDVESVIYIQGAIDGFLGSLKDIKYWDDDELEGSGIKDAPLFMSDLKEVINNLQSVRPKIK